MNRFGGGQASVRNIKSTLNPADLGFKAHLGPTLRELLTLLYMDGVHEQNPRHVSGIDRLTLRTEQEQRILWMDTVMKQLDEYRVKNTGSQPGIVSCGQLGRNISELELYCRCGELLIPRDYRWSFCLGIYLQRHVPQDIPPQPCAETSRVRTCLLCAQNGLGYDSLFA